VGATSQAAKRDPYDKTPIEGAREAAGVMDITTRTRDPALRAIISVVDSEPVEDGIVHPAEQGIAELVRHDHGHAIFDAMFGPMPLSPARIASLLRLLGRAGGMGAELRMRALKAGLASNSIEVRDAAVQAAELWGDPALAEGLRGHEEASPWLAQYTARVARDLAGQ
jgi:hypothetical protein